MVVDSILPYAKRGPNDHQKEAPLLGEVYIVMCCSFCFYCYFLSLIKFKICELATGNKCTEEWNVLPEDSPVLEHDIREEQTILDKNFALMTFNLNLRNHEPSELMVLNLATRQRLWIKGKELETEIRAKISEPFDWHNHDITKSMMLEAKVR